MTSTKGAGAYWCAAPRYFTRIAFGLAAQPANASIVTSSNGAAFMGSVPG